MCSLSFVPFGLPLSQVGQVAGAVRMVSAVGLPACCLEELISPPPLPTHPISRSKLTLCDSDFPGLILCIGIQCEHTSLNCVSN